MVSSRRGMRGKQAKEGAELQVPSLESPNWTSEETNVSTRQIMRMVGEGKFPPPIGRYAPKGTIPFVKGAKDAL